MNQQKHNPNLKKRSKPRAKPSERINRTLVVAVIASAILSSILLVVAWIFNAPVNSNRSGNVTVTIDQGMTLDQVGAMLEEANLVNNKHAFKIAARILGVDRKIQPGTFLIERGSTNSRVLGLLMRPMKRTRDITIPEGLTIREIAGIYREKLNIDSANFVRLCFDSAFVRSFNLPANNLEGYLFPDTYNFYIGTMSESIISKMVNRFIEVIDDPIQIEMRREDFNLHEIITLASIIEGEVQKPDEAPIVSAVYRNRLQKKMALEADPTIQYIIPDGPRRLRRSDLSIESPYNTYRNRGLPPGPINNPGLGSIRAAMNPADVDYLYFVAQGDGSHAFNKSYDGHLESKKKLDKLRRELDRKNRDEISEG